MKTQILIAGFVLCFLMAAHATGGNKNKKAAPAKKAVPSKTRSTVTTQILTDKVTGAAKSAESTDLVENTLMVEDAVRLNPRAVSFVQDYKNKNTKNLLKLKSWGLAYFNMIDEIFEQHGLPTELKYLAVIESELKSNAVSHVGAVGPWQFMPTTARIVGLKVTKHKDERKDYFKSTHAAAIYLKDLYNIFGDWLLVLAAYNGGPGPVYAAIRKSGSRNFWHLQQYLPAESRMHVKKFIGTHYILEGQGGITTLTKAEVAAQMGPYAGTLLIRKLTTQELKNAKTLTISGKYLAAVIAKYIHMSLEDFNRYNPEFDKMMAGAVKGYDLKIPADKVELFVANKYQILNESVEQMLSSVASTSLPRKTDVAKK
ncbi:MAG TPA: lytic transglycosylase domain-containing protein [Flavitalea sp.]|nr:lytic transglycosylase domain-containing protein [Flavitalea sp.]